MKKDKIVFTFGRFVPFTKGHEKLIDKVLEISNSLKTDHCIFISQTTNNSTDPLTWAFKSRIIKQVYSGINICKNRSIKTPFQALQLLASDYNNVVLVVGDDRIEDFENKMSTYAVKWGIKNFNVISSGIRNDSNSVEGISGTKVREYVKINNIELFKSSLPDCLSEDMKLKVFKNLVKGMKLKHNENI